jgi:hypothetical protein
MKRKKSSSKAVPAKKKQKTAPNIPLPQAKQKLARNSSITGCTSKKTIKFNDIDPEFWGSSEYKKIYNGKGKPKSTTYYTLVVDGLEVGVWLCELSDAQSKKANDLYDTSKAQEEEEAIRLAAEREQHDKDRDEQFAKLVQQETANNTTRVRRDDSEEDSEEDSDEDANLNKKKDGTTRITEPLSQDEETDESQPIVTSLTKFVSLYTFKAVIPGELSINEGDILERLCSGEASEWNMKGLTGETGFVNSKYLKEHKEEVKNDACSDSISHAVVEDIRLLQQRLEHQEFQIRQLQMFAARFPATLSTVDDNTDDIWITRRKHATGRPLTEAEYDELHTAVFAKVANSNVSIYGIM